MNSGERKDEMSSGNFSEVLRLRKRDNDEICPRLNPRVAQKKSQKNHLRLHETQLSFAPCDRSISNRDLW